MKISDFVRLREEVIRGEITGWINLRGLFEGGREADADYIFNITYPITEIKNLIEALDQRIKGKRTQGFFEIMGGYGTGKSHILLLLYHLFKNPDKGKEWLKRNSLSLKLPDSSTVLAIQLMDYPPEYLWEPIFKGLGREDLIEKVRTYPGASLLKEALKDKDLVIIIIDELESWYRSVDDKDSNLNFLQVLAEVSCEEKSNLIVFCALYGEVPEITARTGRVGPYRVNLTLSRDRPKVVLFRLIDGILNPEAVSKVAESYVEHYRRSELEIPEPSRYKMKMVEYYPIHPELMDTLLTRYSSSPNYQNTRGVLYLLSSVLSKMYEKVDLLLSSDVDMDEEELLSLGRLLVENAKKDAESIGDSLTRRILNVILLYSFGEEGKTGASRDDVILGVLRPNLNVNDVDVVLEGLPNVAPHVWPRDGKYIIGLEANPVALIQNMALSHIKQGRIDGALTVLKEKLKRDRFYYVYHPNHDFSDDIPDDDRIKIVVSLKSLNEGELLKLYEDRDYSNTLIVYVPKPEAGDLVRDEDLLIVAERINLCDEYMEKASVENKRLIRRLKDKDDSHLRSKLSDIYGYWVKVTEFKPNEISYRLVPCALSSIRKVVREHFDIETMKKEVLDYLKEKEGGVNIDDMLYDFKIALDKPILLDDRMLKDAINSLEREGEVIISGKTIWLREYYQPEEVISVEEERPIELGTGISITIEEGEQLPVEEVTTIEEVVKLPKLIEIGEFETLYTLSVELERKISEESRVGEIKIVFKDMNFENMEAFLRFLKGLQVEGSSLPRVELELKIEKSIDKRDLIRLIDKLAEEVTLPRGSRVKATVKGEQL